MMKKFMLRGREKEAIADEEYMPKSLEYGVWYNMVTPFDWQYFKLSKASRYVLIYDNIGDKKPDKTITKKRFLELLTWVKSPPQKASGERW